MPGPVGISVDRHLPGALRPGDRGDHPGGEHRRHRVGGGRGVAEIAGQRGAALDLGRADQVHRLDQPRPVGAQLGVLGHFGPRDRDADAPAAIRLAGDLADPLDMLDVDQRVGRDDVGAQLHQNVSAARQEPHGPAGRAGNGDGILETARAVILHGPSPQIDRNSGTSVRPSSGHGPPLPSALARGPARRPLSAPAATAPGAGTRSAGPRRRASRRYRASPRDRCRASWSRAAPPPSSRRAAARRAGW